MTDTLQRDRVEETSSHSEDVATTLPATERLSGFRKACPGRQRAEALVENYTGLPETLPYPQEIPEILATSGDCLPFPAPALRTLNILLSYAHTSMWSNPRGPYVWPSNETLSLASGLDIRTVKKHLAWLERAGAIYVKQGPGGRRRPLQAAASEAQYGDQNYGIYLAPLVETALTAKQASEEQKREARIAHTMRARIVECRQEISSCIEALRDRAVIEQGDMRTSLEETLTTLLALEQDVMESSAAGLASRRPGELEMPLGYAERAQQRAYELAAAILGWYDTTVEQEARTEGLSACPDTWDSPKGDSGVTQKTTTQPTITGKRYAEPRETNQTASRTEKEPVSRGNFALEESVVTPSTPDLPDDRQCDYGDFERPSSKGEAAFTPALALYLYPGLAEILKTYCGIPPEMADRIDNNQFWAAIDVLRARIGLSERAFGSAVTQHGFSRVAALVIIAAIKPGSELRVDRKAWLAGTLKRSADQIHIWPTLHKFRKQKENRIEAADIDQKQTSDQRSRTNSPEVPESNSLKDLSDQRNASHVDESGEKTIGDPARALDWERAIDWFERLPKLRQDALSSMYSLDDTGENDFWKIEAWRACRDLHV